MCVAMWHVLIWVIWEEIKAKYKVVADSDSVVNIVHYLHKVAVLFLFLDKMVYLSFSIQQCLIWLFKYSFNHTQQHKISWVKARG